MTNTKLLAFMRGHLFAAQSTISADGRPQSAVVGIAVTDDLDLVFDTVETSRKARNLRAHPEMAFVIGGFCNGQAQTVQYEGLADEPTGAELDALREHYLRVFPDGRERLLRPGLIYVRVQPVWIRHSDFATDPPTIHEFGFNRRGERA